MKAALIPHAQPILGSRMHLWPVITPGGKLAYQKLFSFLRTWSIIQNKLAYTQLPIC